MDRVLLSVAICTRDRAASLERTLASLERAAQGLPCPFEVLVVDNGSADGTAKVAEAYAQRLPLTLLSEPRPGLSRARNAAVKAFRGRYLVWTDDDVILGEGWLEAYRRAFEAHPKASFFGGSILPRFEPPPPAWLAAGLGEVATAYSLRDAGRYRPRITHPRQQVPFGANFAVRRKEQLRHRYDAALGRGGKGPGLGEETDLLRRILSEGGRGVWLPEARVEHVIGPERQTLDYLRRYHRAVGRSLARRGTMAPSKAFLLRRYLVCKAQEGFFAALGRHRLRLRALVQAARARGALASPSRGKVG